MPPASPAVEIDGLVMAYGDKVAVDGLSLEVARGSITAVLGPNGAGKTTTLETCEGYRVAQRGTVRVLGLDPQRDRAELLPRIGVMLQSGGAWSGVRAVEMRISGGDYSMMVVFLEWDACAPVRVDSQL